MNELIKSLEPAINKLSEVFCVSVDTIREHGMEYILMYGKYEWVNNLIRNMLLDGILLGLLMNGVVCGLIYWITYEYCCDTKKARKYCIIGFITTLVLTLIITYVTTSIQWWMNPEIYSIKAVLQLVNGQ